jgi:tetratricopeptide (TPR) repeat protein
MKPALTSAAIALAAALLWSGCTTPATISTPRLEQLNTQITANPNDAQAHANRGYVRALLGQKDAARKDLRRAVELADTGPMHNQVGWAYFNMSDAADALHHWQVAAERSKGNARYDYYSLALGYWVNGDITKALLNYDLAAKRDARLAEAKALAERITNWTDTEKREITAIFTLWSKAYSPAKP